MSYAEMTLVGNFDRPLTEEEGYDFAVWMESFDEHADDGAGLSECRTMFEVLNTGWSEYERLQKYLLDNLPPGVTCTLEISCISSDGDFDDTVYYGPRATELKVAEIDRQIEALQEQRTNLLAGEGA